MSSEWDAPGVKGWLDRLFTPRVMRGLFAEQLAQLDEYVSSLQAVPR